MGIANQIKFFNEFLAGTGCKLVAISKTKSVDEIREAYAAGQLIFGENKVQELLTKYKVLPPDVQWHMVGHLQTNKVRDIVPFIHLIHSVDSIKLLKEIDKHAGKIGREVKCLLQVHIADETTKFGFSETELLELLHSPVISEFQYVIINGLMGMATFTEDEQKIRLEFRNLKRIHEKIKADFNFPNLRMEELSMGMSGDYRIAVEEGSTLIRVGTLIFGERNYENK